MPQQEAITHGIKPQLLSRLTSGSGSSISSDSFLTFFVHLIFYFYLDHILSSGTISSCFYGLCCSPEFTKLHVYLKTQLRFSFTPVPPTLSTSATDIQTVIPLTQQRLACPLLKLRVLSLTSDDRPVP